MAGGFLAKGSGAPVAAFTAIPLRWRRRFAPERAGASAGENQKIAGIGGARHLTAHVRPCPTLLRCQRDKARILDPARAADAEHTSQLERGADVGPSRGPLRRQSR